MDKSPPSVTSEQIWDMSAKASIQHAATKFTDEGDLSIRERLFLIN